MTKSGIVLQADKKVASLLTSDGSFIKVKIAGNSVPREGQIYSGEIYRSIPIYKQPLVAAVTSFFVFLGGGMYTYYTPAAELTVGIDPNPSVKLTVNRWNRIIKSSPLSSDGEKLLSTIRLSNKKVDDGLGLLIDQAKSGNIINNEASQNSNIISIYVNENKNKTIDLSKLEETIEAIKKQDLNIEVVDGNKSNTSDEQKLPEKNEEKLEENNGAEDKKEIKQDEKEVKQQEIQNKQEEKKEQKDSKQDKDQSSKETTNSTKKSEDITENKSVSKDEKKTSNSSFFSKLKQNKSNTKK
jgi:hypothetical protein